jgi:hypothetical protein
MRVKEFKKDGFVVELDEGEGDPDKLIALQCKNPIPDDYDNNDENIDETGKGFQPKAIFHWKAKERE